MNRRTKNFMKRCTNRLPKRPKKLTREEMQQRLVERSVKKSISYRDYIQEKIRTHYELRSLDPTDITDPFFEETELLAKMKTGKFNLELNTDSFEESDSEEKSESSDESDSEEKSESSDESDSEEKSESSDESDLDLKSESSDESDLDLKSESLNKNEDSTSQNVIDDQNLKAGPSKKAKQDDNAKNKKN